VRPEVFRGVSVLHEVPDLALPVFFLGSGLEFFFTLSFKVKVEQKSRRKKTFKNYTTHCCGLKMDDGQYTCSL